MEVFSHLLTKIIEPASGWLLKSWVGKAPGIALTFLSKKFQKKQELKTALLENLFTLKNYPYDNFDLPESYKQVLALHSKIISLLAALSMHQAKEEMEAHFARFDDRIGGMKGSSALGQMKGLAKKIIAQLNG